MLRLKIAHGAAWMLAFRMLDRSLGLVSTFILARLLLPADFGIVAMAMSVIALIELASAFGLDIPLIQKDEPTREHYDTAWTLNLLFTTACALATAAFAYPTALFFGEPRLAPVMLVIAAGWAVEGFQNIGIVNFRRSMQFQRETKFLLGKRLAGFIVGLTLALWLRSYWALVAGMLTTRLTGVALSYLMEPYRPRVSLRARGDLFSISGWLFVNNLLHFGMRRVSHFLIGRIYSPAALGLYTIGAELAYLPQTEMIAPVNRAVFPGYARMIRDAAEMRATFIDINAFVAALALPASVGLAVVAEPLVFVLLGAEWSGAVPVLRILAFAGAASALMSNTYSAYLALGRPYIPTVLLAIELLVLVPGMIFLPGLYGVAGVAYAELIAVGVGTLCSFPVLFATLHISIVRYLSNLWRPVVAAAFMGICVTALTNYMGAGIAPVVALLVAVPTGVIAYAGSLFLLWFLCGRPRGAEQLVIDFVSSRLRAPLRRVAQHD